MNKSSLPHTALINLKRRTNLLGLDTIRVISASLMLHLNPGNSLASTLLCLSQNHALCCYLDMERKQSHKYFALSEPESYTVLLSRYGKEISLPIDHNTLVHSTRRLNPLEAGTISVLVVTNICCTLCILFFTFPTRQIL